MARTAQIGRFGAGLNRHLDRARSVIGRDARGDAMLRAGINAHRERGLIGIGVAIHHQGKIQRIQA